MNGETLSTRFAYHYDLTLSLALPGPEFSAEDRRTLENGINSYNERSIYMNNPKHISLLEMGKNHIKIRLSSTQMLTTPGRGLRALTAILVKTPPSKAASHQEASSSAYSTRSAPMTAAVPRRQRRYQTRSW